MRRDTVAAMAIFTPRVDGEYKRSVQIVAEEHRRLWLAILEELPQPTKEEHLR